MFGNTYSILGQPISVPVGSPPVVPQLLNYPNLQHIVPTLTSYIINILSSDLNTNGRIYVFNDACNNNSWQSNTLLELVELACIIVTVGIARGQILNDRTLYDSADQAVALYVSQKILQDQQLYNSSTIEAINAAQQNVQQLGSYIQQMNNTNVQGAGWGNRQPFNQPIQQVSRGRNIAPQQGTQALHGAISTGNVNLGKANTQPRHINQAQPTRVYNRNERIEQQNAVQSGTSNVPKVITKKDWKPSRSSFYLALINANTETESFIQNENGEVIQVIDELPENVMDRQAHKLIPILDSHFQLNAKTREIKIGASLDNLNDVKEITIRAASEANEFEPNDERDEVIKYVYPNLISDVFLESAIFTGKMYQLEHQTISGISAYRCFAVIFSPQITRANCNPILSSLSKYKSFEALASAMCETGDKMQNRFNTADGDETRLDNQDVAMYIHTLDCMLTSFINSFLKHNLSLADVSIDSFVSDIKELPEYLANKYSDRYSTAFKQFEFSIINSLLLAPNAETEKFLTDIITDSEGVSRCEFGFVPVSYSFTFINMLAKELNLDSLGDNSVLIRESSHEMLFNMAHSLFKQSEALPVSPMYNLLITQDNQIFKIYKGFLSSNSYLIGK